MRSGSERILVVKDKLRRHSSARGKRWQLSVLTVDVQSLRRAAKRLPKDGYFRLLSMFVLFVLPTPHLETRHNASRGPVSSIPRAQ